MKCHVRIAGLVEMRCHRHAIVRSCAKEGNKKEAVLVSVGSHNQECEIHPLDLNSAVGRINRRDALRVGIRIELVITNSAW